ncbi:hypothetical protein RB594_002996 [Gaeumannomyces avenae]
MDPFASMSSHSSASPVSVSETQGLGATPSSRPDGDAAPTAAAADSASAQSSQPTVPAACLACRGKHLKCDGTTPCSRCRSSNSECVYIASRRGYKGPRRSTAVPHNPNKRFASSSPPASGSSAGTMPEESCPMLLGASPMPSSIPGSEFATTQPLAAFAAPPPVSHMQLYRTPYTSPGPGLPIGSTNIALAAANAAAGAAGVSAPPMQSHADRCFDSFFYNFHAAHPFVLPKEFLLRAIKEGYAKLDHLVAAIRYIGSLYLDSGPARAAYLDEALRLAYLPTCPRDGFLVQALLLVLIGLDGSCQQQRANQLLADCERIAIEISLNTRPYATANGRGNSVLEESWRRTWWELYVVDGMIAGVHRATNFLLFDVNSDVGLPCEEHQFLSGNVPVPMYMEDFDDQLFSGEDREFSSFAYRIAAARNLGRFMRCPPMIFPEDDNISKMESLLTNWRMYLPQSKKDALNKHCQLDEMMFQALFINQACTIMLHQPHSQLDSSPARSVTSCAPHQPVPSGDAFNTHTRHTIAAACEISRMVTHAVPLLSHTHFFTCVLTLSSIVHLNKWALYFIQDEDDLRQQIRLNIGALQRISTVWRNAQTAGGQVKSVAQEIYRAKKAQQISPAFWVAFTQEQMISSLNADDGIMNDFETILPAAQVSQPP